MKRWDTVCLYLEVAKAVFIMTPKPVVALDTPTLLRGEHAVSITIGIITFYNVFELDTQDVLITTAILIITELALETTGTAL